MPIYEYRCEVCGERFEQLVRGDEAVHCPQCNSAELKRLLSPFGVKNTGKYLDRKKMEQVADRTRRKWGW